VVQEDLVVRVDQVVTMGQVGLVDLKVQVVLVILAKVAMTERVLRGAVVLELVQKSVLEWLAQGDLVVLVDQLVQLGQADLVGLEVPLVLAMAMMERVVLKAQVLALVLALVALASLQQNQD
jgi:hypothetical protein